MGWEEWEAPAHPARCCRGVRSQKNQPSDVSATSSTSGWALSNHKSSVKGLVNVTPLLTLMTSSTYPPLWLLCHLTWFLPLPLSVLQYFPHVSTSHWALPPRPVLPTQKRRRFHPPSIVPCFSSSVTFKWFTSRNHVFWNNIFGNIKKVFIPCGFKDLCKIK